MKMLKRLIALLAMLVMLVMPLSGAAAETEDWRSILMGVLDIMTEDDYGDSYEEYDAYEEDWYEDGYEETYYEYDWPVTDPQQIVNYLYEFGELPDNFITKEEARELGWDSKKNYVGDVAPGMSIGGDRFGNYENLLPNEKGRTWYECDANYEGKKRNAERVVFSSDGLYYYTEDHYESFIEMFPED